ncbi:MAG TPA: type III-A CRISPR-associated protein Csm2 [Bacteroidales bacterium]|nr:type III-A CRISPR-associated protein Csm2 [Bacteroidales bacterium]
MSHNGRNNSWHEKSTGINNISKWVTEGIDEDAIKFSENLGRFLAKPPRDIRGGALSTSQIRIAYGEITRLKMKFNLSELLMLKPKLAYAAARAGGETYNTLYEIISQGIQTIAGLPKEEQPAKFKNLAAFFEAVLAYHKANGGK